MSNGSAAPVFRPAMILMSGRILGFILAFVTPLFLVRIFTQEEFGTYKQLFLVVNTVFIIAQMGMAESLYYFLPRAGGKSDQYILNSIGVLGLLGLPALAVLWLLRDRIALLLNNEQLVPYMPYAATVLFLMLIAVVLEVVMTNRKQHALASCTYALSDLIRALLFVLPVWWLGNLQALMAGAVCFSLGRFFALLVYLKDTFKNGIRIQRDLLYRHLRYAIPFGLAGIIEIIQVKYHLYAVSYYFDAATFALYAVGCLQIPLVDYMMTSTSYVMMINMREKAEAGRDAATMRIWHDTIRKLGLILIPMIGGFLVVGRELIIFLFTGAYEESVPVFLVWTLGMSLTVLLTDGVLRVFAENRFLILQNLIRLGLIVIFIRWFLTHFGLIGAVMVTLLANVVARGAALARLKNIFKVSWSALLPWGSLAVICTMTGAAAVPAVLVKPAIRTGAPGVILLSGLLYLLSYYFLLKKIGPMDREEKAQLMKWTEIPVKQLLRLPGASGGSYDGKMAVQGLTANGRE